MRAGFSTVQQTLTSDAASVLNQSISEAGRRNHGQTTPLHVAATLLALPSGFLRQACIRSHPNSSHPLQCRALELCFSVALERLPTAQNTVAPASEPPISNALMAALKRAQAHQRRGCPEQQQQPLLAVKVELEQLIISILDDPSVSRVMREASFSSPAVKATIEQSLNNSNVQTHHPHQVPGGNLSYGSSFGGIGPRILSNSSPLTPATPPPAAAAAPLEPLVNRNMYLNPRLQTGARGLMENQKSDEVKKVLEIMERSRKRNPILVGDSEPEAVVKELLTKIENKELGSDGILKNLQVLPLQKGLLSDKNQVATEIEELRGLIESKIIAGGVVLDLGDLKWLVEQPASLDGAVVQQPKQAAAVSDAGRAAVVEVTKLLASFCREDGGHDNGNKLWLIGTASCETFLRCQVYYSTMETDWDLQAVPIASRSPAPGMFPRLGAERLLSNTTVQSLNSLKTFPVRMPAVTKPACENMNPVRRSTFCPQCSENYEKELDKLAAIQKSFSEAKHETRPSLPQWLQSAKLDSKTMDGSQGKDHDLVSQQKKHELQKKWRDTCLHLHPNFHHNVPTDKTVPPAVSAMGLYNSNSLSRPSLQPRLQMNKPLGEALQLNMNQVTMANNPPGSHVRTDLFLGTNVPNNTNDETSADQAKDFLGCISSEPQATKLLDKFAHASDADTYKKLLKGLMERAWWQAEAAAAVASAVTRFRLEDGKRHGAGSRGDIWLLFTGPDRVGKKKMASVLSEQICGATPIMICLGIRRDDEESDNSFRGKTAVDRIAEGVRRNPCSVIMLEDIDEADMLVRGSIKRAIERGRLIDSHGREVGLGNAIFIVTGDWSITDPEALRGHFVDQNKLASVASGSWQLGLIVRDKSAKRRATWLQDEDRSPLKPRRETSGGLSLDLNLSAASYGEDDRTDGSDLTTIDHDDEPCPANGHFSITSVPHELASNVDESIVFRPIESSFVRREIRKTISMRFSMVVDENLSIEIGDDVLEKILGGLCHDHTSLKEWVEKVVDPGFEQLKSLLPSGCDRSGTVVRLVVESDSCHRGKSKGNVDWLPGSILV